MKSQTITEKQNTNVAAILNGGVKYGFTCALVALNKEAKTKVKSN